VLIEPFAASMKMRPGRNKLRGPTLREVSPFLLQTSCQQHLQRKVKEKSAS
jgi:hypothetical protein